MNLSIRILYLLSIQVLAAAMLGIALPIPAAAQETLPIYYMDRAPYYIKLPNGQAGGFLVEVTRLILDEAGVPYRFEELPPKRILAKIQDGEFAGSVGWFKTPERESFAKFSLPFYRNLPMCIVINADKRRLLSEKPTGGEIVGSGLQLGVIAGFSYGSWLDGLIQDYAPPKQAVNVDTATLFHMIARGRVDYIFVSPEEAIPLMDSRPDIADKLLLVRIDDAPEGSPRHLMFGRAVPDETLARIDRAVLEVIETQAYRGLTEFKEVHE
jgi:uncharacterized protein (TIGR02285 family)